MSLTKIPSIQRWLGLVIIALFAVAMISLFAADPKEGEAAKSPSSPNQSQVPQLRASDTRSNTQASTRPEVNARTGGPSVQLAAAKTKTAATSMPQPTPSQNVTINLINRLVQRGVLTQADADELIKQAEEDAVVARAQIAAAGSQRKPNTEENSLSLVPGDSAPPPIEESMAAAPTLRPPPGPPAEGPDVESADDEESVRVQYVPEVVKAQLRDEIKREVMEEAREENWANPRMFPPWALRFTPFADFRGRYEGIFFPSGNDNTGAFPNFNAINTGSPFDVTGTTFSPQLNVDQDRNRVRARVRFGAQLDLEDNFTFGIRIATGENNSPVTTNQSLGGANGQGGDFSKYAIWLDRAFVRYELGGKPNEDFVANMGRFDNPFFKTSELIWDDDLGFDGLSFGGKYKVHEGITPFVAIGGFPVFNTELNFSSNRPDKFPSEDKWLLGGQIGTSLRFNKDFSAKIAGAYYDFEKIQGKLSDPFVPLTTADQGNTDDSRPAFAQKGNTYFPIRNIIPSPDNNFGTTKQFQYFGLATPFRLVNVTGSLDYAHFDPFHLTLYGEFVENVAFDYNAVNSKAINNRGPDRAPGRPGNFAGGNTGWIIGMKAGSAALQKRWDWNVGVNYRYIESDAVVDGFNDSDFGGGGTNLKGYTIYGAVAITPHVALALRWMSADEIGGPTFRNDILQFDFNAKF